MANHFETLAIHAGQEPDPTTGAVIPPIYQTSTYAQAEVGVHKGYEYSRTGNPTRTALEHCLAALEGVELAGQSATGDPLHPLRPSGPAQAAYGLAFASGMAATDMLLRLVGPGEHVLAGDDVYGGTYRLFERVLRPYGLDFTYVDMSDLDAVKAALRPNTRLVWLETPTNPLLKVADIAGVAALAREHGHSAGTQPTQPWVAVDNTFASPYLQRPLSLGADFSLHSTTKYLSGHSDVVGGALVTTDREAYERLKYLQNAVGAVPGPMDCFLTLRGIKTLALRMERHSANALRVAQFLQEHAAVERVIYPGLPDHPGHAVAAEQMRPPFLVAAGRPAPGQTAASLAPLFGGMVSFIHRGGLEGAKRAAAAARVFTLAESLGGVESLIEHPGVMTHASVAGSPLQVPDGLIRLSVGIENVEDLIADLENALME